MVVRLAQPGEREAVFNIAEGAFKNRPKDPTVTVHLVSNPEIETAGKVRYVSPQADPATRTYTVRVSLPDAPPQMRLGANVVGTVTVGSGPDRLDTGERALPEGWEAGGLARREGQHGAAEADHRAALSGRLGRRRRRARAKETSW